MTHKQIQQNAEMYACTISEGPTARHGLSYRAYIAGAESRQPEIDKAKEIIKDQQELLDSVLSGAEYLSDFAQNTLRNAKQFLKDSEVKK